jgi:hypothetical protein
MWLVVLSSIHKKLYGSDSECDSDTTNYIRTFLFFQ